MKLRSLSLLILASALPLAAQDASQLTTPAQKRGYAIGMNIGQSMKSQQVQPDELDVQALGKGLQDALSGNDFALTTAEAQEVLNAFQTSLRTRIEEQRLQASTENKSKGEAFLAKNKERPEVKTTESGLQYEVIEEGTGASPSASDTVKVHYRGTLIDGKEFDSSYSRGQPAEFRVNGVISGWTEALQKMKEGGHWKLYIPSGLAYGERGSGASIGPNETLVFEVQLLELVKRQPQNQTPVTSDIIKVPSKEELEQGAQIEVIKKEDLEKYKQQQKEQQQPKGDQ